MYTIPEGYSLFQEDLQHIDRRLAGKWEELRGAHLFITGGTGFFGIWLIESLLWANSSRGLDLRMTVLSRDPDRFLAKRAPHLKDRDGLRFVKGSLTDFNTTEGPYSHVLHAASENNLENTSDWASRHLHTAIDGTRRLLDMAAHQKTQAVLLITSGAVYGQVDAVVNMRCVEGPVGIDDYVAEKSVYGQTKRIMEIMGAIAANTHGYRALIARCFCFVGPYLPLESNYAIGNFIRDGLARQDIVISGDGTPLRSFLYAADLVIWLMTILLSGQSGRPYNVGGKDAVSISDLAHTVGAAVGYPEGVVIRQQAVPGVQPSAYLPDVSRAQCELGLDVLIDLPEAIKRTLVWHQLRRK